MANQPKKYKKFVATAATATLVASAIVPVASAAGFPDVADTNSHAKAINALVEAGIIKGYEDGTFKPNGQLTRGHVVKMLGKWVEAQGFEIPADYNTVQRFDDVAVDAKDQELVKYAALVKDTGVFLGSNGDLNAAANITRENMALTLDRAYKAVFGKSLVELAAGSTNKTVADLATAKEEAREEIQALVNLGISTESNFRPKETVTRGQFASFLNRTIEAQGTPATEVSAIKSATATKVNEVTVVFDAPVKDTEAAKFAFARGTSAINVTDVDWSEDKTTAVLTVDTKFVDATYTLTVTGVAEKELTASIKTTREEVTTINFLSNKLVYTGATKTGYEQAVIAFEALNQYGEDITKNVNNNRYEDPRVRGIRIDKDNIKVEDGKFIVWVDEDERNDQTGSVEFTYVNGDYELDAYQEVTLSDISEPGSVELLDIYNSSNKALTTKNLKDVAEGLEEFYVLFKVKDQYGVQIDPEFADKVTGQATSKDTTILDEVRRGLRATVSDRKLFELKDEDEIKVINVDGKYYFALELDVRYKDDLVGGENVVEFRARATGETSSKAYKVEHSSEVYKVELNYPDEVIAGSETVKLPVTVTDQNGEVITDAASLNDDLRTDAITVKIRGNKNNVIDVPGGVDKRAFTFIEEKGQVYLKFKTNKVEDTNRKEEVEIEIEVDKSRQDSSITLRVEPDAYPSTLVKLKDTALSYVYEGSDVELEFGDFIIEDQYGRVFDKKNKDLSIKAVPQNENFTTSDDTISVAGNVVDNKLVLQSVKGNSTVQFTLASKNNKKEDVTSKLSVTFRSVDEDDFTSYAVYSDNVVNGTTSSDVAGIEVYGVLSNGVEVELPKDAYKVIAGDYLVSDGSDVVVDVTKANIRFAEPGLQTIETGVKVVINANGKEVSHALKLLEEAPKFTKLKLKDYDSLSGAELTSLDVEVTDGSLSNEDLFGSLFDAALLELKDQYDTKFEIKNDNKHLYTKGELTVDKKLGLTISNINTAAENVKPKNNGTNSVSIDKLDTGDSFDLTISVDGVSKTVKVYIK